MMNKNNQYRAAALYAGGWRAEDMNEIQAEYNYTPEDAAEVCEELKALEEQEEDIC